MPQVLLQKRQDPQVNTVPGGGSDLCAGHLTPDNRGGAAEAGRDRTLHLAAPQSHLGASKTPTTRPLPSPAASASQEWDQASLHVVVIVHGELHRCSPSSVHFVALSALTP